MVNPFEGKSVAVTGKLVHYTRKEFYVRLRELGARPASVVSKSTGYLIAGARAGSKLIKARELGIPGLSEWEFERMV